MKSLKFLIVLCSWISYTSINAQEPIFITPEIMPRLAICPEHDLNCTQENILQRVQENIKYPDALKNKGLTGKIILEIYIGKDGKLLFSEIKKGLHPILDKELLRCINLIEDWIPGTHNSIPVPMSILIPFQFNLQ